MSFVIVRQAEKLEEISEQIYEEQKQKIIQTINKTMLEVWGMEKEEIGIAIGIGKLKGHLGDLHPRDLRIMVACYPRSNEKINSLRQHLRYELKKIGFTVSRFDIIQAKPDNWQEPKWAM